MVLDEVETYHVLGEDWKCRELEFENIILETGRLVLSRSWRLLAALGLEPEAYLKQHVYFWKDHDNNPIWKDTFIYAILNK